MRIAIFIFFLFLTVRSYATDSLPAADHLKGYKKWFYKIVLLHPKINSPLERALLKHYLAGSGTAFLFADSDFVKLKNAVGAMNKNECTSSQHNNQFYCTQKAVLDGDIYFGWGLGTITCIFTTNSREMISFADVYDFNKKKKGQRKRSSELATRIFRLLAPRSAKSFIVSYGEAAYSITPD